MRKWDCSGFATCMHAATCILMDFQQGYWVLDGGLATEMENRGFSIQGDPLWSARLLHTHPAVIAEIHCSYLQHGADIITTASYQASVDGFCKHLKVSCDEALNLIGQSVTIATEARSSFMENEELQDPSRHAPLIAGSVGPYGACQHDGSEYHGNYVDHMSSEQLVEWHRPRVARLLEAGVDILACETLPAKKEAEALVKLLQEFPTAKAWVSFSCKDGLHTCHGDIFSEAVAAVCHSPHIMAVGINCSHPEHVQSLLHSACEVTNHKPFIVYPNSGEGWSREEGWVGGATTFTHHIPRWMKLGARIIGGCCRVGPSDIATIRHYVLSNKP